jgi:long-chain acyl-CoA synthetase
MRVADLLEHSAAAWPDRVAVTHLEQSITYVRLWQNVCRLSQTIGRLDQPAGARIAILFENSIDYVTCFFAVLKSGHVVVPLDTSANPQTLRGIIQDCGPQVLFCGSRFQRHLPSILGDSSPLKHIVSEKSLKVATPGVQQHVLGDSTGGTDIPSPVRHRLSWDESPSTLAAIYYTSGSTGASKGVMLSHRNLVSNTLGTVEYLRLTETDSVIVILPFYYIYGNSLLLTHVACGGRLVIDNRFLYPEVVLDTMEAEKVTGFSGVPSNFIILLGNSTLKARALPHLRYFTQAGGAMAPEVTQRLMDAFPLKEIWIMYGQTEAAPRASYLPPERLREKLGSIGIAVPGVTLTVVDDDGNPLPTGETGQIMVSGPNVMLGYWNQPQETAEVVKNGSLLTGDLARQDEDGYFFIVGRKKEIIKTGGNRVAAKEVEECLLSHEKILEASVFGVPDGLLGEAIKAVVVLRAGQSAEAKEIQDHCKRHLAPHKAPKHIVFADSLPKKLSGKIDKQLLASQYS